MGLWDRLKSEFIDIIEWLDSSNDTIVYRFERYNNEIKYGAKLVVREGQEALFINEGELADVFGPGTYELETKNMPILSTLKGWKYGFQSPFKAEVYFVNKKAFTDLKWGTKNPIMLRDPEFGPVRLRAFGSYTMKIQDSGKFLRNVVGTDGHFTTQEITSELRNLIVSRFAGVIGKSKIPVLDLAGNYDEMANFLLKNTLNDFQGYGINVTRVLIENISLPPKVEEALDKRSSMGIIGNLNAYSQFQTANAIEQAANNPSGGAANGMGMGMGFAMANQMGNNFGQQQNNQNQVNSQSSPPPINTPPQISFYANLNGNQSGPFSIDKITKMIQSGELTESTMVWKSGMSNWLKAGDTPELDNLFPELPPIAPPPINTPPQISFYANLNGNQSGPFSIDKITQMIKSGEFVENTMVWKSGMPNWLKAGETPELDNLFPELPPVSPPPIDLNLPQVLSTEKTLKKSSEFTKILKGQKVSFEDNLSSSIVKVAINWNKNEAVNYDIDLSIMLLSERKKLENEADFIFYNQPQSKCNSVHLNNSGEKDFQRSTKIDLDLIPDSVKSLLFSLTINNAETKKQNFGNIKDLKIELIDKSSQEIILEYSVDDLSSETAIIPIEIYNHKGNWKIKAVGTGFNKGLDAIIKEYASENVDL